MYYYKKSNKNLNSCKLKRISKVLKAILWMDFQQSPWNNNIKHVLVLAVIKQSQLWFCVITTAFHAVGPFSLTCSNYAFFLHTFCDR